MRQLDLAAAPSPRSLFPRHPPIHVFFHLKRFFLLSIASSPSQSLLPHLSRLSLHLNRFSAPFFRAFDERALSFLSFLHSSRFPTSSPAFCACACQLQAAATECSGILRLADLAQLIRVHPLGRKDLIVHKPGDQLHILLPPRLLVG
jgi:hypothetical protein